MKKLLSLWLLLIPFCAFSQEICGNEIDDDNNNLIDCYDPGCEGDCPNTFFIGSDTPQCTYIPPVAPTFSLQNVWRTDKVYKMDARQNVVVGDVDGDGMNEVIGIEEGKANGIYIFDGSDGSFEDSIISPIIDMFMISAAIADCDKDGIAEIFIVSRSPNAKLYCYEYDGSNYIEVYSSDSVVGYLDEANWDRMTPAIADFNGDGIPEVYLGNQIYNALTGDLIMEGGEAGSKGGQNNNTNNTTGNNRFEVFPVAADVLDSSIACPECDGLELVAGNQVYTLDFSDSSMAVKQSITGSSRNDGWTAVSDFDNDGDLDGIVIASRRLYVWDLQTNTQIGATFIAPVGIGGRPNVADFDGDDTLEIGLAANSIYYVIENDMTIKWSRISTDGSARTGSTVFDFEGDGKAEVIYRDEDTLYIFRGTNGDVISKFHCISGTRSEYPLVADVNIDGQAEIICACGGNDTGFIQAYNSPVQSWVSSRKIWNQHGYHVTNINDDLTVPIEQQWHHVVADSHILNNFLVQATYLKYDGRPAFSAPDDSISMDSIGMNLCLDGATDSITVIFDFFNTKNGAWPTPAGTAISFYNGDPFVAGSSLLGTTYTTVTLDSNESEHLTFNIPHPGDTFILYALANDNGLGSLPLTAHSTNIGECNFANNIDTVTITDCSSNLPLPVNLLSFEASLQDSEILLRWATGSEKDNSHFDIERKIEGGTFELIGTVQGKGTVNYTSNYLFIDRDVSSGHIYFYRLKQVDFDGKYEYSQIRSVKVIDENHGILEIHPNPTKGLVNLTYQSSLSEDEELEITLFNSTGKVVERKTVPCCNQDFTLNLASIRNGIYYIELRTKTEVIRQKLIKL